MEALDYVCIFTGGSIRGGTYIGAFQAMEESHVNIKCLVGSSVGAVMATLYLVGYNTDELKEILLDIDFNLFKDINISLSRKFALSKGELFLTWLREKIEKKYYGSNYKKEENPPVLFKDLEKDLKIITTDLYTTEVVEFSREKTPDFEVARAVRISASMPGLMLPIEYEGRLLVDGDLTRSWPVWRLLPNLLKYDARILEFRLEGAKTHSDISNPAEYFNIVVSAFFNFAGDFVIQNYTHRDKFDYIRLDAEDVNLMDFNLSDQKKIRLINIGYDTTMKFFSKELPAKRLNILPHYKQICKEFAEILKNVKNAKYVIAKNLIAELFVSLNDSRQTIDFMIYQKIFDICKKFRENLSTKVGFLILLKDKKSIETEMDEILGLLQKKISEIDTFLLQAKIENLVLVD